MDQIGSMLAFAFYIVAIVIWIWVLIDILKSEFKDSVNKVIWLLAVFFVPPIGVILYYFIGRGQKR